MKDLIFIKSASAKRKYGNLSLSFQLEEIEAIKTKGHIL